MTDKSKIDRSNLDGLSHIEQVEFIFKPIERNVNIFMVIAIAIFGFMFLTQFIVWQRLTEKADKNEVITKFEYYQNEVDAHEKTIEAIQNPERAKYMFSEIKDRLTESLGFKLTYRGGQNK